MRRWPAPPSPVSDVLTSLYSGGFYLKLIGNASSIKNFHPLTKMNPNSKSRTKASRWPSGLWAIKSQGADFERWNFALNNLRGLWRVTVE